VLPPLPTSKAPFCHMRGTFPAPLSRNRTTNRIRKVEGRNPNEYVRVCKLLPLLIFSPSAVFFFFGVFSDWILFSKVRGEGNYKKYLLKKGRWEYLRRYWICTCCRGPIPTTRGISRRPYPALLGNRAMHRGDSAG